MMKENPYQAPHIDLDSETEPDVDKCPSCPECGKTMEAGYIASSASLYWRKWNNQNWLLRGNESLSKTSSVFGINKLSGFRCGDCEIVLFAYGEARKKFSPKYRSQ